MVRLIQLNYHNISPQTYVMSGTFLPVVPYTDNVFTTSRSTLACLICKKAVNYLHYWKQPTLQALYTMNTHATQLSGYKRMNFRGIWKQLHEITLKRMLIPFNQIYYIF